MIIDLLTESEKKLTKLKSFKEGEILFYENDVAHVIGIVLEGELTISSVTFEGNEIIYNRLTKGRMFANNLIFSSDNKFRGDVKAVSKGKVYLIDKNNLVNLLMHNERFLNDYLSIQSDFAKSLNSQIKLLSFNNAKERFLYYLFINNNHIYYKNITTLSQSLFLTREATSRLISNLVKNKKILKNKHEIKLID